MANNSDGNTITIENINNPYIKDISVTTKQNINNNFDINSKANKCNNSQTVTEKQQQQQREPIVLATSASSDKHQEYSVSGIKPLVEQCLTSVLTNCAISSIKPKEGQLAVNKTNTSAVNISTAPESTITSISSDITPNIVNLPKTSTNVNHNNETKKLLTNISSTVSPGAQQTTVTYSSLQPGVGRQKATKNSAPGSDTTITTTNTTTTTTITNSSTSQPKSISPLPLWTLSSRFPIAKYSSFGANNQLTLPSITLTDLLLDIKVKSVEATLIPLVNQITTLVNAREKPIKTEKQLKAIVRVGQSVNLSVERFVAVGEAIADDNPEIRAEMCDACKDARAAGTLIEQLCESATHEIDPSAAGQMRSYSDKSCMVRAARALLSSVTRVLLIADTVVVKQLISTKDRVSISLNRLENVANFTEFVKAFSQFGTEMVELAHLTGDRQNDLKDERRRAQMSCARQILERSTMMLLTSSKCCLRHPDCDTARDNRDTVFLQMRRAMDLIHMVVKDGVIPQLAASAATYETNMRRTGRHVSRYETRYQTPEWKLEEWDECITAYNAVRRLHDLIEMCRMTFVGQHIRDRLNCALAAVVERTQDFTDSAYTSHERRERILLLCDRARLELNSLLRNALCLEQSSSQSPSEDFEASITQTLRASIDLKNELQDTALDQIDELLKLEAHHQDMVGRLRNTALASDQERLDELCEQFNEYCERVQEVCRLLHHTSPTDTTQIKSKHLEMSLEVHGQQLIAACHTLAVHPNSKIAKENLDVFADVWHLLCGDLTQLAREVSEHVRGCPQLENSVYLPQQRYPTGTLPLSTAAAGTSTSTMRSTQPFGASQMTNPMNTGSPSMSKVMPNPNAAGNMSSRYSDEESKGKGQSSDTDMGTDVEGKASNAEDDNDIARKVKSMSTMATSMLQFTRGEGELKTTQDLFTQAEFFADEGNKLYKIVRHFSYQVPSGPPKKELLDNVDKVPTFVQQLQFAVKNVTVGKAATFTKVDNVIQETKNLMSVINLVAKNCANCANQYNLDMQGALRTRARTLSPSMRSEAEMFYDSSGGMGIKGGGLSGDPDI